jgi:hypothetical protein
LESVEGVAMKRRPLPSFVLIGVLALTGCGGLAARQAGPGPVTSTASPFDCSDAKYRESVNRDPFECKNFTSTAGTDYRHNLTWLATNPLRMSFSRVNGTLTMTVRMPCGTLNVPSAVTARTLTTDPERLAETANGCSGTTGDIRRWTVSFLKSPLTYSLTERALVLTNDLGQIEFKQP